MSCVVDASVLYLVLQDERQDPRAKAAKQVLAELAERFVLLAPELLAYEMANLVHARRTAGATLPKRQQALEEALAGFRLVPTDKAGRQRMGTLIESKSLTGYDAAYLELAQRSGARLLTEDRQLHKAASAILPRGDAWLLADAQDQLEET